MFTALAGAAALPAPVLDWHALAPEIILVATICVVLLADLVVPDRDGLQSSRIASVGVLGRARPDRHARLQRRRPVDVRRRVRRRPLRGRAGGLLPRRHLRHDPALRRLRRRGRLLQERVLRPAAHVGVRHGDDGVGPRPHHAVRGARDDLHPHVHPRRVPQARPRLQRGGREVLPDRRAVVGAHALRHVADLRRHRARPSSSTSARTSGRTAPRRCSPSRSSSRSSASRSRSARCRSTSGRPTPTRARPRRSPRSCRSRRRPAASSPSSTSSTSASTAATAAAPTPGGARCGCSPRCR